MTRTSTTTNAQVIAFAAAVREALNDLPAEDVDELVDGLEADLTERAADGDADFEFGDPDLYAAELRSAAGLPDRSPLPPHPRQGVQHDIRRIEESGRRIWRGMPQRPNRHRPTSVREFICTGIRITRCWLVLLSA